MKKFYLFSITLLTLLIFGNGLYAQDFGDETTMTRQEARKAARAAHRKAIAAENQQLFEQTEILTPSHELYDLRYSQYLSESISP